MHKKLHLVLAIITSISFGTTNAQTCITDDFSTSNSWTKVGSTVSIAGGKLSYNNAAGSSESRIYSNVSAYKNWEISFSFIANETSSSIPAAFLMGLSAGSQDSWYSSMYTESNQDALGVYLRQINQVDKLFLATYAKNGNESFPTTTASTGIEISYGTKYYIKISRPSDTTFVLSAYSDEAQTNELPGSPVVRKISANIKDLNVLQSGISWGAADTRILTADIDNLSYCDIPVITTHCFTPLLDNAATWTQIGTNVSVNNSIIKYTNAECESERRVYKAVGQYEKWDLSFSFIANSTGSYIPAAFILGLTSGSQDSWYSTMGNESIQDALGVYLRQINPGDSPYLATYVKNNNDNFPKTTDVNGINIAFNQKIYIKLSRTTDTTFVMAAFSDALFTQHLSGSPVTKKVSKDILNLNTIQSGISWGGASARILSAEIAEIDYCGFTKVTNLEDEVLSSSKSFNNLFDESNYIEIYSSTGELICQTTKEKFNLKQLNSGLYIVKFIGDNKISTLKIHLIN